MRQSRSNVSKIVWLAALLAGAAGCQNSPPTAAERQLASLAERQLRDRGDSIAWTATTVYNREATAPMRLEYSFRWALNDVRHDARQLEANATWGLKDLNWHIKRFERNLPVYGETAAEIIWAKPETIPWTSLMLFF